MKGSPPITTGTSLPPSLPSHLLLPSMFLAPPFFFGLGLWRQLKNGNVVQLPIDHRLITDLNIWRLTEYSIFRLNTKQLAWNHSPITTTISKQTKGSPKQTDYMFIPELLETEIKSRREDHSKISVLEWPKTCFSSFCRIMHVAIFQTGYSMD